LLLLAISVLVTFIQEHTCTKEISNRDVRVALNNGHDRISSLGLLKILHYGHPLLREKATDLKAVGPRERDLIAAMAETMYAARGIGLAATQVGVMERLFVVDVDQDRDAEDPLVDRKLQVFINPVIIFESEEDEPMKEGCLSIPGVEGEIYRPSSIRIVGRDENFEPIELDATELLARVIQHETDHLNGILFIDKMPMLKRTLLGSSLSSLKRATEEELPRLPADYPIPIA
jgi:peptide deformylase